MPRHPEGDRALTNAERQARFRARRAASIVPPKERLGASPAPMLKRRPLPKRRTRVERWNAAVAELIDLQSEYRDWLESLPASLRDTATAEVLKEIADLDLSEIGAVILPRGFGRD